MSRHPLIERLLAATGGVEVTPETIADFESAAGDAVLFFGGDPVRFPELLDVAVVLPELRAHFGGRWRVGVVPRAHEDAVAARWAVQRWPSLVFMRDGLWLGTVAGMKDWDDYLREVAAVLAAEPKRRPTAVIALRPAEGSACH